MAKLLPHTVPVTAVPLEQGPRGWFTTEQTSPLSSDTLGSTFHTYTTHPNPWNHSETTRKRFGTEREVVKSAPFYLGFFLTPHREGDHGT